MSVRIQPWVRQSLGSIDKHQELVDAINEGRQLFVDGELTSYSSPSGRSLVDTRQRVFVDRRIGRLVKPKATETVYGDARYIFEVLRQKRGDDGGEAEPGVNDPVDLEPETDSAMFPTGGSDGSGDGTVGNRVIAHNLYEKSGAEFDTTFVDGSHNLPEDGSLITEITCWYDREDVVTPHWFFWAHCYFYLKLTHDWTTTPTGASNQLKGKPCTANGTITSSVERVINLGFPNGPNYCPFVTNNVVMYLPYRGTTGMSGVGVVIGWREPQITWVTLTLDGGGDGNQIAACNYTYTVKDVATGIILTTGSSPIHQRKKGKTMPATIGIVGGYGGTPHGLWWTDELATPAPCP